MDSIAQFDRLGGIRGIGGGNIHPMTEAEISSIEAELACRFPEDYRIFLIYGAVAFNGTSPENPFIVVRSLERLPPHISSDGQHALFDAFYGGGKDSHDPYSLSVRIRFFKGRMPTTLIPIGDDSGAGQFCIGVSGAEFGKVYYWDQRNEPQDEEDYFNDYGKPRPPAEMYQNVYKVADSFQGFLEQLNKRK